MTNTISVPSYYTSSFIGFDRIIDELMGLSNDVKYPPTNIIQGKDGKYNIEIAVAGFAEEDLDINLENQVLTINGLKKKVNGEYLHQGISNKGFKRKFNLSDHIEVIGAKLENGILSVSLERIIPEELRPKKITINGRPKASKKTFLNE